MPPQTETARQLILEPGTDSLLTVKDNPPDWRQHKTTTDFRAAMEADNLRRARRLVISQRPTPKASTPQFPS